MIRCKLLRRGESFCLHGSLVTYLQVMGLTGDMGGKVFIVQHVSTTMPMDEAVISLSKPGDTLRLTSLNELNPGCTLFSVEGLENENLTAAFNN